MKRMVVVLALLLLPVAGRCEVVKNEVFSFNLPDTWVAIPQAEFKNIVANCRTMDNAKCETIKALADANVSFDHGYEPVEHRELFASPYILVDTSPRPVATGMSRSEQRQRDKESVRQLAEEITGYTPYLLWEHWDATRRLHTMEYKIYRGMGRPNMVASVSKLDTNKGQVLFAWYAEEDEYGVYVDTLRGVVNSIEINPGLR